MQSETITAILSHAPATRCFAIGSDDLAHRHSERATRNLPKPQRRQAARRHYQKWKRNIDSIIADAKDISYEATISRLEALTLNAVRLAFDPVTADETIDLMADEIRQSSKYGIGIWEQHASDELVFVWLWNDK